MGLAPVRLVSCLLLFWSVSLKSKELLEPLAVHWNVVRLPASALGTLSTAGGTENHVFGEGHQGTHPNLLEASSL